MTSVGVVHNNPCVCCGAINIDMIRVGAIILCKPCFGKEFTTDDPIDKERDVYLKWLKKSQEQAVTEGV